MKLRSCDVVFLFVCLLSLVKHASSIFCYDCNSAYDPRCGEEFDPFSLGVVNCSLQDPPEHISVTEPTLLYGKVRVVRKCGYIVDEEAKAPQPCRRQSSTNELYVTYCACDTDLCNPAPAHTASTVFSLVAAVIVTVFRVSWSL